MKSLSKTLVALQRMTLAAATLLGTATLATAVQAEDVVALEFGGRSATELRLPMGRSQIISSPVALEQVVIGSPEIADIKLLSARRVLILGIKPGRTNLVFREKGGDLVSLMDVVVGYDLNGVKRKLAEVMPQEKKVEVRDSNDRVILSGQVSSAAAMDKALNLARSYVPAERVLNLLEVGGGQQVMLEARIAEVSRNSLKDLGVQTTVTDDKGAWTLVTGAPLANAFGTFNATNWDGSINDSVAVTLQALEKKGLAKTLAEPNLVAMSGQEANFLAGGEIPIPVAQSGNVAGAITVDYKEFGVGLRFTPTVLDADRINLKLVSEVSAIDNTNAVAVGFGINVPAISTRRAGTTIELGDGQSFAIAGLLQSNDKNALSQIPGLGNLPVLGALFRSSDFQREETEVVVVVTARLVKPVTGDQLALPTDVFTPPSDIDHYLLGRLEGSPKDRPARAPAGGGVAGDYGHQSNAEKSHAKQ
jgi:pilus assembly protein CpaC